MENFLIGMFVGVFGFAGLLATMPSYHKKAVEAIKACEASLPRDEHCTIIALPVSKD